MMKEMNPRDGDIAREQRGKPVCSFFDFTQAIAAFCDKLGFTAGAMRFPVVCSD
jgi:hypothetical protein